MRNLRILHTVEFYEPSKGGAQEVVRQLSERLVRRGHDVTVATSAHPGRGFSELNGVKIRSFDLAGNSVRGVRGDAGAYQDFISGSGFDLIMNYAAQIWTSDLTFPLLESLKSKKVFAPLGYSRLHDRSYGAYFEKLPAILRLYDSLVYTSAHYQDKRFGDEHGVGDRAVVIPNGASKEEFDAAPLGFRKRYGIDTKFMILSVSNHYFAKGHFAVLEAFRKSGVRDATLVLLGERPSAHSWFSCYPVCSMAARLGSRIRVLSGVPRPWVVSAYQEADLFLFGSTIECAPLVMYESFASHTPFVTRPVGNVRDHEPSLYLAERADEMAERIREFAADPSPFQARAREAYRAFAEHFSWEQIAGRYESLYSSLVEGDGTEGGAR